MSHISTLIFDFGDVFINLDKKGAYENALTLFGLDSFPEELNTINGNYEKGLINTQDFLKFYTYKFPKLSELEIIEAWNYILKDFPKHRLEFIQQINEEEKYNIILLSNTNELHIDWIKNNVDFFDDFKQCFHQFYLSHEIGYRKPDTEIYEFVLNQNRLSPNECLFVDDLKENTKSASKLGINTWNINPKTEDVTELFKVNFNLF